MTEGQLQYRAARQSSGLRWKDRNCREMPGAAGLQRVLEEKSGDAGTSPGVCDAGAACCSFAGEGPCLFRAQACRRRAG
jgi:hypothetical protein